MENKAEYLNFPISFFTDKFFNVKNTLSNIMRYATGKYAQTLEYGTDDGKIKASAKFFNIDFTNLNAVENEFYRLRRAYDTESPNVSLRLSIMWDYYKHDKNEFQIACFRAFCSIKSILGASETVITNKEMIIARMFGRSKPKKKDKDIFGNTLNKEPEFTTSISDARLYIINAGYEINSDTIITDAIKSGDLHAEKRNNGWKIKKTDLTKWAKKSKLSKKYISIDDTTNEMLEKKYSKRYQIDKVLTELQLNWGLNLHAAQGMRGFRLSFKKDIEEIAVINEKNKKKTKIEALKERKKKASENAKKIVRGN